MAETVYFDFEIAKIESQEETTIVRLRHAQWNHGLSGRVQNRIMLHVNMYSANDSHHSAEFGAEPEIMAMVNGCIAHRQWEPLLDWMLENHSRAITGIGFDPASTIQLAMDILGAMG